jgi:hypothetical protein
MVLTGSLPQLTSWGEGVNMKSSSTSWHYEIEIEVEKGSSEVLEFQYMYNLIRPMGSQLGGNDMRSLDDGTSPVWQSKISRCKLDLAKVLDHTDKIVPHKMNQNVASGDVKVIIQATGVDNSDQVDLFTVGTNPELGDLDLRNARWMKKMASGTYHSTIYVRPTATFVFWFSLIRKSSSFFNRSTIFLGNLDIS